MWNIRDRLRVSVEELQWYEDSVKVYTLWIVFFFSIFKSISKIVRSPYPGMEPDFRKGSM